MAAQYEKPRTEDDARESDARASTGYDQQDQDSNHATTDGNSAQPSRQTSTSDNHRSDRSETELLYMKDATGRNFQFPFQVAKTWQGMESLIQQASHHIDTIGPLIKAGHYYLISPDGNTILPSVWEQCVKPGWLVTMRLWKDGEDARKEAEDVFKKKALEEAKLKAEGAFKRSQGKEQASIQFKDAVGRKFSFPFHLCKSWAGMEELIKQAFLHVDVIGPHVQAGHYDLIGPSGEIILPQVWERVIEPDWMITMAMWPMDRPPISQARPRPPGMQYPPGLGRKGVRLDSPGPPPPPDLQMGLHPDAHVSDPQNSGVVSKTKAPVKRKNRGAGGGLGWMGGGKRNPKKQQAHTNDPGPANLARSMVVSNGSRDKKTRGVSLSSSISIAGSSSGSMVAADDYLLDEDNGHSESNEVVEEELGARQEARGKDLIVVCKPSSFFSPHQRVIRRQTARVLEKTTTVPRRLEISSARVYWERPLLFQSSSLELVRRSNATAAPGSKFKQNEPGQMTWLHVTRNFMNFHEFEDIALFGLSLNTKRQRLVSHLTDTIRSKRTDEDWYVKPGTILRCDTSPEDDTLESAIFVSLPTLHERPSSGRPLQRGETVCRERKLHEAFDHFDATHFDEERNGYSRHDASSQRRQVFWVRQTWLLLVGESILTYGSLSKDALEAGNITIHDEFPHAENGDRIIQVMDEDRRLFYIPSSKCKSFYEFQVAVTNQFVRTGRDDIKDFSLHFNQDGHEITPGRWLSLLKQSDIPLIGVELKRICVANPYREDSSSSATVHNSKSTADDDISLNGSMSDSDRDDEESNSTKLENGVRSPEAGKDTPGSNSGFLLISLEPTKTISEHSVPELNRRVPPFLSWISAAGGGSTGTVADGLKEAITRIELKLIRPDEKPYSDSLMEEFHQAFSITGLYDDTASLDYELFRHKRASLYKGKQKYTTTSSFFDDTALKLADEYFDVALLTLESFILPEFQSALMSRFFGALAAVIKDPTSGLSLEYDDSDPGDPDFADILKHDKKPRWVISRKRCLEHELFQRHGNADTQCKECEKGIVYPTMDSALAHLRREHVAGTRSDDDLRHFALPLAAALKERLSEDQCDLLRNSRDEMLSVLRKLVSIQDGVIYDNEFREQRGLPQDLLEACKWIFVYVRGVSHTLHDMSWFYKDELCHKDPKDLNSSKVRTQRHILSKVGVRIENLARKAERVLTSPTFMAKEDGPESFVISVGQHYVATRLVCNILRAPVHNNKQVTHIYEAHTKNLGSKIMRNPTKRHILDIGALKTQLGLIKDFREWQKETLYCFDLVINPESYPRGFNHEEREKLFGNYEWGLISWEDQKLEKDIHQVSQLLLACGRMVQDVRELTDIMKDDQGRTIFIFTTVTIIFLPLSFVATYISMSSGTTGLDWGGIQALFWEVSGPLTLGILSFCLCVARKENILNSVPAQWVEKAKSWRDIGTWKSKDVRHGTSRWEINDETTKENLESV